MGLIFNRFINNLESLIFSKKINNNKYNIMKKIIFLICILPLIVSCSTSNDDDNNNDPSNNPSDFRYLSEIRLLAPPTYDTGDVYSYEDDKLKFAYFPSHLRLLNYFEYNSENMVSKRYKDNLSHEYHSQNWDPNSFDLDTFIANTPYTNYIYSDGRLIEESSNGSPVLKYTYNDNGYVQDIEYYHNGELASLISFIYLNDKIDEVRVNETYYNQYKVFNFEYDNKINPFYTFYQKFGIPNLYTGRESLDLCYTYSDYFFNGLFKNNITKMYIDGDLRYTAQYEYDSYGYPKRIAFTRVSTGEGGIENVTYLD